MEARYAVPVETLCINLARATAARQVFDHCLSNGLTVQVLVYNAGMLLFGEGVRYPAVAHEQAGPALPAVWRRHAKAGPGIHPQCLFLFGGHALPHHFALRALQDVSALFQPGTACRVEAPGCAGVLPPARNYAPLYDGQGVNVSLARKLGIMGEAEAVARTGLKALCAGRAECVPGLLNKPAVYTSPGLPDPVAR